MSYEPPPTAPQNRPCWKTKPVVPCSTISPLTRKPLTSHSSTRMAKSSGSRTQRLPNSRGLRISARSIPQFQQCLLDVETVTPQRPQLVSASGAGVPQIRQNWAALTIRPGQPSFEQRSEKIPINLLPFTPSMRFHRLSTWAVSPT